MDTYEKRYKEANDKVAARFGTNVAKEIFTDLYESEDEKIRKELIDFFQDWHKIKPSRLSVNVSDILDWLEKQGKKDSQEILPPFTFNDVLALQCCMETAKKVQEDKDLYEKLKDLHDRVYDAYQLKKQSKQKETLCDKCKKEHPSHSCQDITVLGRCAIEHEQKPIEPKFKVGDKIYLKPEYRMPNDDTPIANTVKEIKEVDNELYKFDGAYIFIEDQDKYELVKQKPWNEEDEEALEMAIIALEDMYDDDTPNATYGGHYMPFDKAANRLKSLKDKIQTEQEWSEEDDNCLSTIIAEFSKCAGKSVSRDEWMRCNDFLNSLKNRVLSQSKQEWGEEDENRINHLIAYFEDKEGFTAEDDIAYANWLKSLKDRVQPKNNWKPSYEQMDALYTYIYNPQYFNTPDPRMELVISVYEDLKKLVEE